MAGLYFESDVEQWEREVVTSKNLHAGNNNYKVEYNLVTVFIVVFIIFIITTAILKRERITAYLMTIKKPESFTYTQYYAIIIMLVSLFEPFVLSWFTGYQKSLIIQETLFVAGFVLFVVEIIRLSK